MEHNKDQSGAVASEKPQFPWNPDPINHEWTQPEIAAIHAFGEGCFQAGVSSVQSRAAVRGEAVADERWCLACDKAGHHTDECWSTYATNTPQARELMRLCHASVTSKVSARAADAPYEPSELPTQAMYGMHWPEGYVTDPNGKIIPPKGRCNDFNFGYDNGYADGLQSIKDTVANIGAQAVAKSRANARNGTMKSRRVRPQNAQRRSQQHEQHRK